MLGADFTVMDYLVWNEIPTVIGNLVGGLTFVGLVMYATHGRTAPSRRPAVVGGATEPVLSAPTADRERELV
jgi:hypothetical protein